MGYYTVVRGELCFFFFQAEDGIRDSSVTGVQTCALPIWPRCASSPNCRWAPVRPGQPVAEDARSGSGAHRQFGEEAQRGLGGPQPVEPGAGDRKSVV